jgi:hypothetical protein
MPLTFGQTYTLKIRNYGLLSGLLHEIRMAQWAIIVVSEPFFEAISMENVLTNVLTSFKSKSIN